VAARLFSFGPELCLLVAVLYLLVWGWQKVPMFTYSHQRSSGLAEYTSLSTGIEYH
jgi:hypothetical protein